MYRQQTSVGSWKSTWTISSDSSNPMNPRYSSISPVQCCTESTPFSRHQQSPTITHQHSSADPISKKKLKEGDGLWEVRKEILGWIFDRVKRTPAHARILHAYLCHQNGTVSNFVHRRHGQYTRRHCIMIIHSPCTPIMLHRTRFPHTFPNNFPPPERRQMAPLSTPGQIDPEHLRRAAQQAISEYR